jgi:hypothetical protein
MKQFGLHAGLFVAALAVMWVAGMLPSLVFRPTYHVEPSGPGFSLEGWLRVAPILLLLAGLQMLVFRWRLKQPGVVYLAVVALILSVFCWAMAWLSYVAAATP